MKTKDKYAVIGISGKQYLVEEGQELEISKNLKPEARVLLVKDNEKVLIGKPEVKGAKVVLKELSQTKGKKITVLKYKSKSRYRKKIGFRPLLTKVKITKITTS